MPWQEGLGIALMISMSRSTNKITAGKIIELSISSFGSVSVSRLTSATFSFAVIINSSSKISWNVVGHQDVVRILEHTANTHDVGILIFRATSPVNKLSLEWTLERVLLHKYVTYRYVDISAFYRKEIKGIILIYRNSEFFMLIFL